MKRVPQGHVVRVPLDTDVCGMAAVTPRDVVCLTIDGTVAHFDAAALAPPAPPGSPTQRRPGTAHTAAGPLRPPIACGAVCCCAVSLASPDGPLPSLWVGCRDGQGILVFEFDEAERRLVRRASMAASNAIVSAVTPLPGERVVSHGIDCVTCVWDACTHRRLASLRHEYMLFAVAPCAPAVAPHQAVSFYGDDIASAAAADASPHIAAARGVLWCSSESGPGGVHTLEARSLVPTVRQPSPLHHKSTLMTCAVAVRSGAPGSGQPVHMWTGAEDALIRIYAVRGDADDAPSPGAPQGDSEHKLLLRHHGRRGSRSATAHSGPGFDVAFVVALSAHGQSPVTAFAAGARPDGTEYVWSAAADGALCLWDATTCAMLRRIPPPAPLSHRGGGEAPAPGYALAMVVLPGGDGLGGGSEHPVLWRGGTLGCVEAEAFTAPPPEGTAPQPSLVVPPGTPDQARGASPGAATQGDSPGDGFLSAERSPVRLFAEPGPDSDVFDTLSPPSADGTPLRHSRGPPLLDRLSDRLSDNMSGDDAPAGRRPSAPMSQDSGRASTSAPFAPPAAAPTSVEHMDRTTAPPLPAGLPQDRPGDRSPKTRQESGQEVPENAASSSAAFEREPVARRPSVARSTISVGEREMLVQRVAQLEEDALQTQEVFQLMEDQLRAQAAQAARPATAAAATQTDPVATPDPAPQSGPSGEPSDREAALAARCEKLEQQLAAAQEAAAHHEARVAELSSRPPEGPGRQASPDPASPSPSRAWDLEAQVMSLHAALTEKTEALEAAEAKADDLRARAAPPASDSGAVPAELRALELKNAAMVRECEALEEQLADHRAVGRELTAQLKTAEGELQGRQELLDEAETDNLALREKAAAAQRSLRAFATAAAIAAAERDAACHTQALLETAVDGLYADRVAEAAEAAAKPPPTPQTPPPALRAAAPIPPGSGSRRASATDEAREAKREAGGTWPPEVLDAVERVLEENDGLQAAVRDLRRDAADAAASAAKRERDAADTAGPPLSACFDVLRHRLGHDAAAALVLEALGEAEGASAAPPRGHAEALERLLEAVAALVPGAAVSSRRASGALT